MSRIRQRTARCTPALAAIAAALVGLINVASALTPNIRWRGRLLLDVEPVEAVRLFHAFALPAGAALLLVSPYLLKRRRRAWQAAIGLMLVLGLLDLLKGLDVEETVLTWATAAMLLRQRRRVPRRARRDHAAQLGLAGAAAGGLRPEPGRGSPPGCREGHPSFGVGGARDRRPAGLAGRAAALRAPRHRPPRLRLGAAGRPPRRDRDAPGHGLRGLPSAGRPGVAARPGRAPRGRRARPRPRLRHALVLQAARRQALLLQLRPLGVRRLPGARTACCCSPAIPSGPTPRWPSCSPISRRSRRRAGSKLGAVGASERLLPAVGAARPAHDVPRRRGDHRGGGVLAGGPPDPQGAPVGQPPAQGRLRGRAAPRLRAGARPSPPRSRRCSSAAARARPSAASRWRWTRCDGDHGEDTLVVLARDEDARRSAASCTSCPATGARRCRCRSCAATRARPTA